MNFIGLTKEAKVELSQFLYIEMHNPAWQKHRELLEMIRNCVNSEIRQHIKEDLELIEK